MQTEATEYPPNAQLGRKDTDTISRDTARTLAGLFRERVRRSPDKIAYREFDAETGEWKTYTWTDTAREVARWQDALRADGLQKGERVALRLENCWRWIVFDQAALGLGLVPVPLYVDDRAENIAYILEKVKASLLLTDSCEVWQEVRSQEHDLSSLKRVVLMQSDTPENDALCQKLDEWLPSETDAPLAEDDSAPTELATVVFTSGTTGKPKGVMLSHDNIVANCEHGLQSIAILPTDLFLSFLPLSHMLERMTGYYLTMMSGAEVAFNRSIPELIEDLGVLKPTCLVSVPRIFERAYSAINTKVDEGSPLKKKLFNLAIDVGWLRYEHEQKRAAWHPKLVLWPLLEKLVAAKIQNTFGGRLRLAISGGAPLAAHVSKLFVSLGIKILQGYGLTETSPVLTVNTMERNRTDSIGLPINSVELRIGDSNELLARGPNIMLGYWENETATKEVIDDDGWFHTGDCARIENGFLFITGRLKDILVLSNGEKVPPADMETAISEDALFDQTVVIGEGKPFLSAIVVLNPDIWAEWAKKRGFDTKDKNILNSEQVEKALLERMAKRIESFPGYAQIYQACATLEPWTVENGLLTPTMKLKRPVIKNKFQSDIEKMYEGH